MPCLLFVPFSLLASKKSSDTRKYHLLIKRNPLYFLGAFFHLLGKLGLLSTKVPYLEILIFHLLVSRVASYPVLGLPLKIYAYISRYMCTSQNMCTFRDDVLLEHGLLFCPTCQVI